MGVKERTMWKWYKELGWKVKQDKKSEEIAKLVDKKSTKEFAENRIKYLKIFHKILDKFIKDEVKKLSKQLAPYKRPINISVIDQPLPRTATRKIQRAKVKELISKQLNRPIEEITDDKEIVKDLGADSLDVVEMLMSLEEEYNVEIPSEDLENLTTVGEVMDYLKKKGVEE